MACPMLEFSQSSWSLRSGHSFSDEGYWWFFSCCHFSGFHCHESSWRQQTSKTNNEQKPGTEVVYSETHWSASCSYLPSKFFWVLNPICSPIVLSCGCWNNHFQVFYPTVLCSGTSQREAFLELKKLLRSPTSPLLRPHRAWSPKIWVVSPEGPKCSNGSWDNFCVSLEALICLQFVSKLPVELVRVHIPGPYPKLSK